MSDSNQLDIPSPEELQEAFRWFEGASQRLEERYQLLLEETQELRARLKAKDLEIQRAARLASLGETAAGLAHEIRNPLGAITLTLSLLKGEIEGNTSGLELLGRIKASVATLNHVVTNMLQFTRDAKVDFEPLHLHKLVEDAVWAGVSAHPGRVEVQYDLQGNPYLYGNAIGIQQVITNVVSNSLYAMQEHGVFKVTCEDEGKGVRLVLKDSGPGFSDFIIARALEPFETTKNEGTGLGLAVASRIVEQHGGRIMLRNDGGAVVEIFLPRAPDQGNRKEH